MDVKGTVRVVFARGCRLRVTGRRAHMFSCAQEGVPSQRRGIRAHIHFVIGIVL